jgi:type II secretory pathway component GspD/PulD (secretin)
VLPERGTYRIEGGRDNMSVFAVGVDAAELLTAIASKSNLALLVDDAVARRLTVSIAGRPARELVGDIAAAYGLGIGEAEGVLMISEGIPRAAGSYVLSQIESVPTKYVDASNARNLLPVFLQDYVKVNSEQNSVVLSAPGDVLAKFRSDIAAFDTPASQILVDLLVVELTDTSFDQLGITFGFANAGEGIFYDGSGLSFRAVSTLPQSFSTTIRALQEKGRARVRANPRIATVSGQRASIFVGRQRYIATPIDTGSGQRNFIDAGVRLGMTPSTGGQGQILVEVDAEVSTLSAVDPITRLPEKSTRTANSVVRVADGQTIIIGGLKQQEERAVQTRIPFLGSLPILGPLFRSRDIRSTTSDLVIFITPRTLSSTGHLPEAEERRLKEQFLEGPLNSPLPPSAQSVIGPNESAAGAGVPNKNAMPLHEGTAGAAGMASP